MNGVKRQDNLLLIGIQVKIPSQAHTKYLQIFTKYIWIILLLTIGGWRRNIATRSAESTSSIKKN